MFGAVLLSSFFFFLHSHCTPQFHGFYGRRVCVGNNEKLIHRTQSFIQPLHKPFLTTCRNQQLCSSYKTVYKVSYRQVGIMEPNSYVYSECCPGWRRHHSLSCNHALCVPPCINGGSCVRPNHCACSVGWTGRYCQIDVDECKGAHGCDQWCLNSAGSYRCSCSDGFRLAEDKKSCRSLRPPVPPPQLTQAGQPEGGGVELVTEEIKVLRKRVEQLEQKLEMVLAPFSTLTPPEEGTAEKNDFPIDRTNFLSDQNNFLSHSLRQLDRIDSLSEQVGFLEERLGTCSCQEN